MAKSLDTKTIYEIYRSCRLCGSDDEYKMPIMPSVVNINLSDFDLRQKIKDCVKIEVSQGDKMPPLICEPCIIKLNDFEEFIEMCQDTDKRTRHRLGLPAYDTSHKKSSEDCILGVTETIFTNDTNSHTDSQKKEIVKEPKPMSLKSEEEVNERLTKLKLEEESTATLKEETLRNKDERKEKKIKNKEVLVQRIFYVLADLLITISKNGKIDSEKN